MSFSLAPFLSGIGTGFGLIIAIGAQNAYVLKQGILHNHTFTIALVCSIIDATLICAGVSGLGTFIASNVILLNIARYGGTAFLGYYGLRSFIAAFNTSGLDLDSSKARPSLKTVVLTVLAVSLLNPHMYLDTCVLIGSIGAQFPAQERSSFTGGAILASFVWFFSLSYGARYLVPLFKRPIAWKILDCIIGLVMWSIAGYLMLGM